MNDFAAPVGQVRRGTVAALAVTVAVLVAAAGLFVVLLVTERGEVREVNSRIADTERELTGAGSRLDDVKSTVDELGQEHDRLTAANRKLRACADAAGASVVAANTGDDPGLGKAIADMIIHCRR